MRNVFDLVSVIKTETITKDNIGNMLDKVLEDKRLLNTNHMNDIYNSLCKGKYFITPLIGVRNSNGDDDYTIAEGQHRLKAIEKYLTKKKDAVFTLRIEIYPVGTDIRKLFLSVNSKKRHTLSDYINLYKSEEPNIKKLMDKLDCGIYRGEGKIPMTLILDSYNGYKKGKIGTIKKGEDCIKFISDLNNNDIEDIKETMDIFSKIYLSSNKSINAIKNPSMMTGVFQALFLAIHKNKSNPSIKNKFIKELEDNITENFLTMQFKGKGTGYGVYNTAKDLIYETLKDKVNGFKI